jgi:hypothetical protein
MEWHAQSLDLNPSEHVYATLKRCLNLYHTLSKNLHELWIVCKKFMPPSL